MRGRLRRLLPWNRPVFHRYSCHCWGSWDGRTPEEHQSWCPAGRVELWDPVSDRRTEMPTFRSS